jgi:hypothetical protein
MCNCVIPSLDFTIGNDVDFDCLSAGQVADLTTRLCVVTPDNVTSTLFDGVNEYVISSYSASHEIDRTDLFSIDCWVKQPAFGGTNTIMSKYDIIGTRRGWYVSIVSNGAIRFTLANNEATSNLLQVQTFQDVPFLINVNAWNHIAVTSDGTGTAAGTKIYINGVQSPALFIWFDALTGTTVDATNVLRFGASGVGDYFDGYLFNAHVWNGVTLTPAEVAQMAATPVISGPVQSGSLVISNRLGGGSLYGNTVRVYPDDTGIVSGYQSVSMELADGQNADYPT